MPKCSNCFEMFSRNITVNGKKHVLSNRKRCLICSPFKEHIKKVIEGNTCTICGKIYIFLRSKGHTGSVCNSCRSVKKRREQKQILVDYAGGKCQLCGYNKCNQALAFHHKDSNQKDYQLAGNHSRSMKQQKAEVDKCILLCHNCHTEIHNGLVDLSMASIIMVNDPSS